MPFHIDPLVENLALDREPVLVPNLLEMNKRELPFAVQHVAEPRSVEARLRNTFDFLYV
jgi:hypothetical protein